RCQGYEWIGRQQGIRTTARANTRHTSAVQSNHELATRAMSGTFQAALLKGKSAFVAGGTSGINLEIASILAKNGASVCVASRDPDRIAAAVAQLDVHGGGVVLGMQADVRDYEKVSEVVAATAGEFGDLDIVVSGAAGNFVSPASTLSANGFKAVVGIDLLGTFNVYRACYPYLRRPGASLISISAPQAQSPYPHQAHVCAAKAGVDMLTKSLALEWGKEGIRANGIIPGPIDGTEGMARLAPTKEAREMVEASIPLRRFGKKIDIANLALFLCSDAASYITGALVPCDGGQVLCGSGGAVPG